MPRFCSAIPVKRQWPAFDALTRQGDADKGTEHDGRNRMKEADHGGFHRRAGNRIHEPEEGKVRDPVANL
ncbi:MAG: hypothetical protein ABIP43_11165, partial [Nitrospiraceae bacterium]